VVAGAAVVAVAVADAVAAAAAVAVAVPVAGIVPAGRAGGGIEGGERQGRRTSRGEVVRSAPRSDGSLRRAPGDVVEAVGIDRPRIAAGGEDGEPTPRVVTSAVVGIWPSVRPGPGESRDLGERQVVGRRRGERSGGPDPNAAAQRSASVGSPA